jgi:Ankyrin repeats (3 copies)/Ankyrin repeats (many copies)
MKKAVLLLIFIFCKNTYCSILAPVNNHKSIQKKEQDVQAYEASNPELISESRLTTFDSVVNTDKAVEDAQKDLNPYETEITPESTDKKSILSNYSAILTSVLATATGLVALYRFFVTTPNNETQAKAIDDGDPKPQGKRQSFMVPVRQLGAFVGDKASIVFYFFAKLNPQRNERGLQLIRIINHPSLGLPDKLAKIKTLIKKGANISVQDEYGNTPLHMAARFFQAGIVKLLLENSAKSNICSNRDRTPLHEALQAFTDGNLEMIEEKKKIVFLLLKAGSNVNVDDEEGYTPLHYAIGANLIDVVKAFLDAGAHINAKDKIGDTPLHTAVRCYQDKTDMVRLLVERGADIKIRNDDSQNETPLEMAIRFKKTEVVKLLRNAQNYKP